MNPQKRSRQAAATKTRSNLTKKPRCADRFRRDRLPMPARYFHERGVRLIGGGEWRGLLCPFHDDKTPSLRVNLVTGAWRCMSCGERGGDILEFHRRLHGLTFAQACRDLGAWEGRP